jgi:hypothetical protein
MAAELHEVNAPWISALTEMQVEIRRVVWFGYPKAWGSVPPNGHEFISNHAGPQKKPSQA